MCTGAMVWSRLERVVIGALDAKAGACGSLFNLGASDKLNHSIEIIHSVLEEECSDLLRRFFKNKRS
jgi:tRNA(adenine34) deaminase